MHGVFLKKNPLINLLIFYQATVTELGVHYLHFMQFFLLEYKHFTLARVVLLQHIFTEVKVKSLLKY